MKIYKISINAVPSKLQKLLQPVFFYPEIHIISPVALNNDLVVRFARIKAEQAVHDFYRQNHLDSLALWDLGKTNNLNVINGRMENGKLEPVLNLGSPVEVEEADFSARDTWGWIINPLSLFGKLEIESELIPPFNQVEDVKIDFTLYLNNGSFDQEDIEETGKQVTGELYYDSDADQIKVNLDQDSSEYAPLFDLGCVKTYLIAELKEHLLACTENEDMDIFSFHDYPSQNRSYAALHLQYH